MISNLIIVYTLKEHGHKQLSSKEATLFFGGGGVLKATCTQ